MTEQTYRIPLPLPNERLSAVNTYAVVGDDGVVLIDGGWGTPQAVDALHDALASIDLRIEDITYVLATHIHQDHYTLAVHLARTWGTPIALGRAERASLENLLGRGNGIEPTRRLLEQAGGQRLWERADEIERVMRATPSVWQEPTRWLEGDTEFHSGSVRLRALATPGHTQGHYVYLDEGRGTLFSGDHILPMITPSAGYEPVYVEQPLRDYLASLQKIRTLPDSALLPAHGPVTASTHARIDQIVAHHDARFATLLDLLDAGRSTAFDLAEQMLWTRRQVPLHELDILNQVLASFDTLFHLNYLYSQDRVDRASNGQTWLFTK